MKDQWLITGPASLIERGNPLLQETPVELSNSYALSEAVVQMRQGFSTEDYSAGGLDGPIEWIARHVTNEGNEEAWAASNNSGTAELARRSSNVWASATFSDTVSAANLRYMNSVPQNGKLFLCYDSDVNRLHVWDGTDVRRVGFSQASAVTAATLGGAGLTFNRWYRKRLVVIANGVVVRRSEPSAVPVNVSITDDSGVQVTRGTVPSEGETHWEVEASTDSGGSPTTWYRIATVAIATTTSDDTNATITDFDVSPTLGLYIPPPSAKYIVSDGAVLLMAGCWETSGSSGQTAPKQNRVWFTRPLGASDVSDDESIPDTDDQRNWIEVGDAGPVTGLYGPVNGEIYVFKAASTFKLVPTGDLTTPYARVLVSDVIGAVDQRLICSGDLAGLPAIYFCDQNSGYTLTQGGIQSFTEGIARDLRQTYITASSSFLAFDPIQHVVYLQVNSSPSAAVGSYRTFTFDASKQQWSGFALGGATSGWILGSSLLGVSTYLGGAGAAINNGAFLEDPDGGRRLYLVGQSDSSTGAMFKWTGRTALDGTNAYVTSVRYRRAFGAMTGRTITTGAPTVWYRNPQGTTSGTMTLQMSLIKNDDAVRSQSKTLAATDDETGIAVKQVTFEGLACADVSTLDARLYLSYSGTAFQSTAAPAIDAIAIPYTVGSPLAQ